MQITGGFNLTGGLTFNAAPLGQFVAVSDDPSAANVVMTSPNGITWTSRSSAKAAWGSIANNGTTYVSAAYYTITYGNSGAIIYSNNGISWTQVSVPFGTTSVGRGIVYGADKFVSVGSGFAVYSTTGSSWTNSTGLPDNTSYEDVSFGSGVYIVVAQNGKVYRSTNGSSWNEVSVPTSQAWISTAYGDGLYIAVAQGGTYITSTNSTSWTSRTGLPTGMNRIRYGNGTFVGVGNSGLIATSTDGITWNTRSSSGQDLKDAAFGNNTWVVVGYYGDVRTSSDNGITWTPRSPSASINWKGVTYG